MLGRYSLTRLPHRRYAESIAQLTPFTRESAVAYFNQMIENIRDPRGYAVWMAPVVSALVRARRWPRGEMVLTSSNPRSV
jgi:hypothetical protein